MCLPYSAARELSWDCEKKIDLWVSGRAGASRGGTESRPRLGSHHHPAHGKLQPGAAWIANRCCPGRCPDISPPGRRGKNCLAGAPVSSRSRPGTIPSRPSSRSVITDWHGKKKKRETETAGPIRRDRSNGSRPTGATLEKRPCGRVDGPERARTGFAVDFPPVLSCNSTERGSHGKLQPGVAWIADRCCPGRWQDTPPGRMGKNSLADARLSTRPRPVQHGHVRIPGGGAEWNEKDQGNRRSNSQRR